jgi:hypothetical protein
MLIYLGLKKNLIDWNHLSVARYWERFSSLKNILELRFSSKHKEVRFSSKGVEVRFSIEDEEVRLSSKNGGLEERFNSKDEVRFSSKNGGLEERFSSKNVEEGIISKDEEESPSSKDMEVMSSSKKWEERFTSKDGEERFSYKYGNVTFSSKNSGLEKRVIAKKGSLEEKFTPQFRKNTENELKPSIDVLPPDWETLYDEGSETFYYWNKISGITSWEFPIEDIVINSQGMHGCIHIYVYVYILYICVYM